MRRVNMDGVDFVAWPGGGALGFGVLAFPVSHYAENEKVFRPRLLELWGAQKHMTEEDHDKGAEIPSADPVTDALVQKFFEWEWSFEGCLEEADLTATPETRVAITVKSLRLLARMPRLRRIVIDPDTISEDDQEAFCKKFPQVELCVAASTAVA